jgi:hypothetical protein
VPTRKTDAQLLTEIDDSKDDRRTVELMMAFYCDNDRAERTSRAQLYFHLGTLCGMVARLYDRLESPKKAKRASKKAR